MKLGHSKSQDKIRLKPLPNASKIEYSLLEKTINDANRGFRSKMLMTTASPSGISPFLHLS
jgi:hypothetical protein